MILEGAGLLSMLGAGATWVTDAVAPALVLAAIAAALFMGAIANAASSQPTNQLSSNRRHALMVLGIAGLALSVLGALLGFILWGAGGG
jgi:hypothetical protein